MIRHELVMVGRQRTEVSFTVDGNTDTFDKSSNPKDALHRLITTKPNEPHKRITDLQRKQIWEAAKKA